MLKTFGAADTGRPGAPPAVAGDPAVIALSDPVALDPMALDPGVLDDAVLGPAVLDLGVLGPVVLDPVVLDPGVLDHAVLGPVVLVALRRTGIAWGATAPVKRATWIGLEMPPANHDAPPRPAPGVDAGLAASFRAEPFCARDTAPTGP